MDNNDELFEIPTDIDEENFIEIPADPKEVAAIIEKYKDRLPWNIYLTLYQTAESQTYRLIPIINEIKDVLSLPEDVRKALYEILEEFDKYKPEPEKEKTIIIM